MSLVLYGYGNDSAIVTQGLGNYVEVDIEISNDDFFGIVQTHLVTRKPDQKFKGTAKIFLDENFAIYASGAVTPPISSKDFSVLFPVTITSSGITNITESEKFLLQFSPQIISSGSLKIIQGSSFTLHTPKLSSKGKFISEAKFKNKKLIELLLKNNLV